MVDADLGENKLAEEKLADARCLLLSNQPVYGFAALNILWNPSDQIETAAVRLVKGFQFECIYNVKFVLKLDIYELAFVICHEIEHVVRSHCIRRYDVDPDLFNIACDYCIHGHRSAPKIGLKEEGEGEIRVALADKICWVPERWNAYLTAEEYYNLLVQSEKRATSIKSNGGNKTRTNQLGDQYGETLDDHNAWDSEQTVEDNEKAVSALLKNLKNQSAGMIPGHWQTFLEVKKQKEIPWQQLLRRFVTKLSPNRKPSILRRSRRLDMFGAPGKVRHKSRQVSVVVDVSGSVSDTLLERFFGELDSATGHAKLDLLLWDSAYQGFYKNYKAKDWRERIKITGRGGTDMAAPIVWLNANRVRSDCRIIFTDGFCNWAQRDPTPSVALIYGSSYWMKPPPWIYAIYLKE